MGKQYELSEERLEKLASWNQTGAEAVANFKRYYNFLIGLEIEMGLDIEIETAWHNKQAKTNDKEVK